MYNNLAAVAFKLHSNFIKLTSKNAFEKQHDQKKRLEWIIIHWFSIQNEVALNVGVFL